MKLNSLFLSTLLCLSSFAAHTTTRKEAIQKQTEAIEAKLAAHGGMEAIQPALTAFRKEVAEKVSKSDKRYVPINGTSFQRGITEASMAPTWAFPLPKDADGAFGPEVLIEMSQQLQELGVDLILVPVPAKVELYHGAFDTKLPAGLPAAPARYELMLNLLNQGAEVLDILPALEAALPNAELPLYEVLGHHMSSMGVRVVSEAVAARLESYELEGRDPSRYGFTERKSVERVNPSQPMTAFEVTKDDAPYKHSGDGQIVVIGDSQAFAHFGAGFASHIARAAGADVTDLSLSSGTHFAGTRLSQLGAEGLRKRKAVVMIFTAVAVGRPNWEKTSFPEKTTVAGLLSIGLYDEATKVVSNFKGDPAELGVDETYLNNAAYRMVATSAWEEAEATFKLNTTLYPDSLNTWDSLAEFYARRKRKAEAIEIATKVMSMNPNENIRKNSLKTIRSMGGDTSQWETAGLTLTDAQMATYLGEYHLTDNVQVTIEVEAGKLFANIKGGPRMALKATGEHTFDTDGPALTFVPQGADMVLNATMRGETRTGKRVAKGI